MSQSVKLNGQLKVLFLGIAILSMLFLALAAVMMAAHHILLCIVFFLCSFVTIGCGFMFKKRLRR